MPLDLSIEKASQIVGSQRALAELLGERETHVSNWKKGTRPCTIPNRRRIAQIAGEDEIAAVIEGLQAKLDPADPVEKEAIAAMNAILSLRHKPSAEDPHHARTGVKASVSLACPCGRGSSYAGCCGRYLDDFDATPAPDAESLMRSRYTAFVRERADYLLATWHASQRPARLDFDAGTRWLGLAVKAHQVVDADHAEVLFVARQRDASGRAQRLQERSRFVREQGRWYYLDAVG